MRWKLFLTVLLAILFATACSDDAEESGEAAGDSHSESAEEEFDEEEFATAVGSHYEKWQRPRFDPRILEPAGTKGASFTATWEGSMGLAQSRFGGLRINVTFDIVDEKMAALFKGHSPQHQALNDIIKDVFRMKRSSELHGADAMEDRREELIQAVNKFFGFTIVRSAYFREYDPGGGSSVW